ncbi:uncharacterized protein wu:fb55g09 [Hemiscyllium ocellatum]|uniref:uncharacterized protein wu:fb55g09 n=1 Tax=Hemiscyllium ocellatum TaxID=170820 RepID=UPI002966BAE3|nr:uncharacterized protein wu:fb55g09 [Hemiscyllium ocellatum]
MSNSKRGVVHWEARKERYDCKDYSKSRFVSKRVGHRWHRRGRAECGRTGRYFGRGHQHQSTELQEVRLRPVNVRGNRAPGMRAPRNTNQFLMHEKYQLMHMRSDSTGSDSGSEIEVDMDIDSYLGVLENARGALDCTMSPLSDDNLLRFRFFEQIDHDQSLQYFPSEDDVVKSERFMRQDFAAFCSTFNVE